VVRDSGIELKGTIHNKTIQTSAYADDIVLVGRTTGVLKGAIMNVSKAVKEMGLLQYLQKNKYMEVTKRTSGSRMLKMDGQELERAS
jgi:hypothetical protein